MSTICQEKLHKLMLKKIRLEIGSGQSILLISDKHQDIKDTFISSNMFLQESSLAAAVALVKKKKKAFSYVIADLDSASLDDLDAFLKEVAPLIIRPGKLILTATNLCTDINKLKLISDNAPKDFQRPLRAVPPNYLKNKVIEHGYFVKNRFWQYDDKLLLIAETPVQA